jgi:hypothetical protein
MGVYIGMNVIVMGHAAESLCYNIKLKRLKDRLIKSQDTTSCTWISPLGWMDYTS